MSTLQSPSEEQRWTQFYDPQAAQVLQQPLPQQSLWEFLYPHIDNDNHDAFIYFGRHISRSQFIDDIQRFARLLRAMGLGLGDRCLLFSPIIPEAVALMLAANMVGATIILPNLAANHHTLHLAAANSRIAFVFDQLEEKMRPILEEPHIEHVILLSATSSMPIGLKLPLHTINHLKTTSLRRHPKYITLAQALHRYANYKGSLSAPYDPNRIAMVFSSGGTTNEGTAKLIAMTDRAMIAMLRSALAFNTSGNPYRPAYLSLALLPPFVCTGFFALVLAPLFRGMTIVLDPRLDEQTFTRLMLRYRPQITLVTGPLWERFLYRALRLKQQGRRVDLSHLVLPIMGGEGCSPDTLTWMDTQLQTLGSPLGIVSGYGMSEAFSVVTVDYRPQLRQKPQPLPAISVGYPFPGMRIGIFDSQGNELPYNTRGEVRVKTDTLMAGYLDNDQQTQRVIKNGWFCTGDLGQIDNQGLLYIYGRLHEHITSSNGQPIYLFDIANLLRQDPSIKDALVLRAGNYDDHHIVAHLILNPLSHESFADIVAHLDNHLRNHLPSDITISGYMQHTQHFRISLVTKTDRNYYSHLTTGYINAHGQPVNL